MQAVTDVIDENQVEVILCNRRSVAALVDNHKQNPTLKTIIYTNNLVGPDDYTRLELPTRPPEA
jgi:hypothetical protein